MPIAYQLKQSDYPKYTIKEWEKWEGYWELIKGVPFAMSPMGTIKHQQASFVLAKIIDDALSKTKCNCQILLPINLVIDKETILHPDLSVVCQGLDDKLYIKTPPNIIIEILSPSTAHKDKTTKRNIYAEFGVEYYWLVDPINESITVYQLKNGEYQQIDFQNSDWIFDLNGCPFSINLSNFWQQLNS